MPPLVGNLGDLEVAEFAELVADVGEVPLRWLRRIGDCSRCGQNIGGFNRRDPSCPVCGGTGTIFREGDLPLDSLTEGKIIAQNAMIGRTRMPVALQEGDLVVTYMSGDYPLGDGDRFILPSRRQTHSERLARGAGTEDKLQYTPVYGIYYVYGQDAEIITGWGLSADSRSVVWDFNAGNPQAGTQYTVLYEYHPEWVIAGGSQHQRVRANTGESFPNRVVMRMFQGAPWDVKSGDGR